MKKEIVNKLLIAFSSITIISIDVMISFALFGLLAGSIVAIANLLLLPMFLITTFDGSLRNMKESFTEKGLRGRKAPPFRAGMDSPLILIYSFTKSRSMTLVMPLPSSTRGIMGLREEHPASSPSSLSWNPEAFNDGFPTSKWGWASDPPDCPPNEGCKPEPIGGTMIPLGGNPRPF